jgi:hypothetical protein
MDGFGQLSDGVVVLGSSPHMSAMEEFFLPVCFPVVLEEPHGLGPPQDGVDILVGNAMLVGSENAPMLRFLLEGRDASRHGREFGRAPFALDVISRQQRNK